MCKALYCSCRRFLSQEVFYYALLLFSVEASRRCATKVFRRAFQQKLQSAPVDNWDVITPFHFSVRYKQSWGRVHFSPLPPSLACTLLHIQGQASSRTHLVFLRHTELSFLNVLIQELKWSKAWDQAKAPPHHLWGPPGQDCCLAHAVKQQKSSAPTPTCAQRRAGLTRARTKTHSRCGRRRSAHGTSTQPLGYLCTNNGKFL